MEPKRARGPAYPWIVLLSGFAGYTFDCMDLVIFNVVQGPSMRELLGTADTAAIQKAGSTIIAFKLFAWCIGGALFGIVADRFGRSLTMVVSILIYAVFTGVSGLAQTWWQLAVFQVIAGIGIGAEWAAGAALVAETWPNASRRYAMALIQSSFAVGFFLATFANQLLGASSWRYVLAVGFLPALLVIPIRMMVRDPERSVRARAKGSVRGMLAQAHLRRNLVVGAVVTSAMMVGSWGWLTLLPNWIRQLALAAGGDPLASIQAVFMPMMASGFVGYFALAWLSAVLSRRMLYFLFCFGGMASSLCISIAVKDIDALVRFAPVYGFFVMGGFGFFGLYLPELFPTEVRATGQAFCYNIGRGITGIGVLVMGGLIGMLGSVPAVAAASSCVYAAGLVAIWFGPETQGKLPEQAVDEPRGRLQGAGP